MELNAFDDVKNASRNLVNDLEISEINKNMNELSGELNEYLKNNELEYFKENGLKNSAKETRLENNELETARKDELKRPIDIDIKTGKNELGDTTILGKITIEKSAAKDLEKIQNKLENVKDKGVVVIKKGLNRVYDLVKDNVIGLVAGKVLKHGDKVLKYGKEILNKGGELLKDKAKFVFQTAKKIIVK